jgi:outer membrane lipoprotein-sorting protein
VSIQDCPRLIGGSIHGLPGIQDSVKWQGDLMSLLNPFPILFSLVLAPCAMIAQQAPDAAPVVQQSSLSLEQVLTNLEQRNAQRAAALQGFEGKRIYRMEYRGFPSDKDAEMVVKVTYQAPNAKEFTVVSETGSKFVIDHVFKKLLEGEQEAAKGENRHDTALTRQNYNFELEGYETTPDGGQYILKLMPKTKNKFLYRGKIWVDAKDFAVVRIEGEPGKNPSFWIKKTDIAHRYMKINDFWLPAENHTESFVRLGGKATLSIEYSDYKITKATPMQAARNARRTHDASPHDPSLDGIPADPAVIWAGKVASPGNH